MKAHTIHHSRLGPTRRASLAVAVALLAACGGGGGGGSSTIPPPPAGATSAVVLTSNFQVGSFAVLPLDDPTAASTNLGDVHSDATARARGGLVFVINRLGADNIQAIDPAHGFATLWQCSVGNGTNPHDIVLAGPSKAYVTRHDTRSLAVVDPSVGSDCAGFLRGEIDLGELADADGIPEMSQMAIVDGRLYVSLLRLDRNNFFSPTDHSLVAVIDVATDRLVDAQPSTPAIDGIRLSAPNPFAETKGLAIDPRSGKILVSEVGEFAALDGGIETIDPGTNQAEGHFVTEADLGGDITDFVVVDARRAYAIVSDASFVNRLIRFDPGSGRVAATLVTSESFLPDIEYEPSRGQLYLIDRSLSRPGVRIFSTLDDSELTASPIDTGLSPLSVVFAE